ncbi:MAG: hypothetical protein ABFD69_05300 [Candidatus Sumerlaeia bacterium]
MEGKQDPWESFNTVGGEQGTRNAKLLDYIWLLIGGAIAGAIVGGGGYVLLIFASYNRHYRGTGIDRMHDVSYDYFSHTMYVSAIVGAVVGFIMALLYCLSCMGEEEEAKKAAERRANEIHPMFK